MGAIALGILAGCSTPAKPHSAPPSPSSCIASNAALLLASQLPGSFQLIHDETFTTSPRARHYIPNGSPPPAISTWTSGHLRGWIATVAVTGPDRSAEDAAARSLGYHIGQFPLVPLIGPVVEHNPGVLEVYETINVFDELAGAKDYIGDLVDSARAAETSNGSDNGTPVPNATPLSVHGFGEALAYEMPAHVQPRLGLTERFVNVVARAGNDVVQVSVQGGSGVTADVALAIANRALARLSAACSTPSGALSLGGA